LLTEGSGSFGGVVLPANVAAGADGMLYLLDRSAGLLKRFDPCECRFDPVPCFGGRGSGWRQLSDPHGIALCGGNLLVCDTGNDRLLVIALRGLALRDAWSPPASADLTKPWTPYGVAVDGRGRVFVTDPANGCIHRFRPTGRWEKCLPGFGRLAWIAIDCSNRVYVVVEGEDQVRIVDADGNPLGTAERPDDITPAFPRIPLPVDAYGNIDLRGFCAKPSSISVFDPTGASVAAPPRNPPAVYSAKGQYLSQALDSELYRCQWHRIVLCGQIPRGTAVRVSTYTTEAPESLAQILDLPDDAWDTNLAVHDLSAGEWDGLVFSAGGRYLWLRLELNGNGTATPAVQSVRVEFPRISLRRFLPAVFAEDPGGANFTDRLLSIFDTCLRSVEREIDHEGGFFDPMSAPATPAPQSGVDFLSWLASWVGLSLDRQLPEAMRRTLLKEAPRLYPIRGTREGLWRRLLLLLGFRADGCCCPDDRPRSTCSPTPLNCSPAPKLPCAWEPPPLILEHFQLRRWLFVGEGRLGDQAVLWGKRIVNRSQMGENARADVTRLIDTADPYRDPFHVYAHKFSVFVPASCGASDQQRRALLNLLNSEKPAHTQYQLEYVEPRFRIGFQSMIGLDTVVGRYPEGVALGQTRLGTGSVLSEPPDRHGGPSFEIGAQSRIGTTTKLD
jgi:phage tail-like protein